MYVVICEVSGINDNSSLNWLMKPAVSAPLVNANISAAKVDLATRRTFHKTGHDILNLSAMNTICPTWL